MCYNVCIAHFQIVELERMYASMQLYVHVLYTQTSHISTNAHYKPLVADVIFGICVCVCNDTLRRRQISMVEKKIERHKNHKLGTNTHIPLNYCRYKFTSQLIYFERLQAHDCLCFDSTTFK